VIKSEKLSVRFIRGDEGYKRPTNFIKSKYTNPLIDKKNNAVGTNENASSELYTLMGNDVFTYPKPVSLMIHLINFVSNENDIILDFFSGSGTSAEGVLKWVSNENKKLNYIMVQLPENLDENLKTADVNSKKIIQNGIDLLNNLHKPHFITELAKERIRRAANKIKEEKRTKAEKDGMFAHVEDTQDYGFRVYRLDSSNMQDVYYRPQDYKQENLELFADNIKPDRTPDDLLAQVMLDWGLPLSYKIEQIDIYDKQVFRVAQDSLLACFDTGIDEDFAKAIAKEKPLRVVFRDRGFASDTAKINVQQLLKQLSPETEMKVI